MVKHHISARLSPEFHRALYLTLYYSCCLSTTYQTRSHQEPQPVCLLMSVWHTVRLSRMVTRGSSKVICRHLEHGQRNGECVSTFNPSKCNIIRIQRGNSPMSKLYVLCGTVRQEVHHAKWLGVTISLSLIHISEPTRPY